MASPTVIDETGKLNDRQVRFCHYYLEDLNATQAYMKAYGTDNAESAKTCASKLLSQVNVRAYIKKIMGELKDNVGIEICEIVDGLKEIACDPKATHNNKIRAYDLLGKYKGMFVLDTRLEISGKGGKPIEYKALSDIDIESEISNLVAEINDEE